MEGVIAEMAVELVVVARVAVMTAAVAMETVAEEAVG